MTTTQTRTMTPHELCEELLSRSPLATGETDNGEMRSVVLRNPAGSYFLLSQNTTPGDRTCRLYIWTGGDHRAAATITPGDDSRTIPAGAMSVLRNAIPVPAHGTMLGWAGPGRRIVALIVVDVEYRPDNPQPSWTVLPHWRAPEAGWPPFIDGGNLLCPKLWEAVAAGQLVSVGEAVSDTEYTVWWVEPADGSGPGFCDVAADVRWDGYTLPAGKYADYRELRRGMDWPDTMDERYNSIDLAPRFL